MCGDRKHTSVPEITRYPELRFLAARGQDDKVCKKLQTQDVTASQSLTFTVEVIRRGFVAAVAVLAGGGGHMKALIPSVFLAKRFVRVGETVCR